MKTTIIRDGIEEEVEVESIDISDRRKPPIINPVLREGEELHRTLDGKLIIVKIHN